MASLYTPQEIIDIAKLSQFYAGDDAGKSRMFSPVLNPKLDKILYLERKSLQWAYTLDSTLSSLQNVADYVYALCGKYGARAIAKLDAGGGGGIIVTPTTPTTIGLAFEYVRRITAADFTNGTDYDASWIAGYEVEPFWNNVNRYLTKLEIQYTPTGFTVWIDDGAGGNAFDARTTNADVDMIVYKRFPLGTPVPVIPEAPVIFSYNFTVDSTVPAIDLTNYSEGQEVQVSVQANGYAVTWASQYEWSDNNPEQPSANVVGTYSLYTFMVIVDKLVCISQSLNIVI
jgi:hypothetical protein